MPFLSLLKKLVVGDNSPSQEPQAVCQRESELQADAAPAELPAESPHMLSRPPPPPLASSQPPTAGPSTTSIVSLRTQVESERQAASSSSMYRDFTGGGHADAGHWNDPPTIVFKAQNQPAKKKTAYTESETSSFVNVDGAVTPSATTIAAGTPSVDIPEKREEQVVVLTRTLREAVESVQLESATAMVRRMAEDTIKRLVVLDERLPELDDELVRKVCAIAMLIDKGLLTEAADAHRNLMQAGHEAELKWLVGIKRVIELRQKAAT
ncbi:hypothetical protein GGF45_001676 [Coemansia sp. RSA 551]|nr:hypothetical protein GGF45_001676 [Coemansia sp. RSA 551]KAJ2555974.1 hypothetical protein IWW35_000259 [Coemansia sp. RSA 1878]